ncbi:hypothetical protein [Paraflavitalea pollutisoli]|uniref:hypothetical protein n=1 Tax=Paraflavitalea pollutisoli TaxID=3034143 RepID=UPI0023EAC282|nr:hypothetical protein [Paraflavitalea sp. H1-2-19X]
MKAMIQYIKRRFAFPHGIACCLLLLTATQSYAQPAEPADTFNIAGRVQQTPGTDSLVADRQGLSIKGENRDGALYYHVSGRNLEALVPALTHVAVANDGSRIWVFGDTLYNHSATNGYANVYDGSGQLIRSLGLLAKKPYMAVVGNNGALAFAGNVAREGKALYLLSVYNAAGDKNWSVMLPAAHLSRVYFTEDNQFVAVSMFFSNEYTMKTMVYDRAGRLIHTHRGTIANGTIQVGTELEYISVRLK